MARVVLVLPPFDLFGSYGGRGIRRGNLPPLGVGYLAGSLELHGHTASLVDATALRTNIEETTAAVAAKRPDVIGISCVTRLADSAYALANTLKRRLPNVPVVMGGPHVTSFWRTILDECHSVDVLIPGEGERVFAELVDRLSGGGSFEDLPGIVYRNAQGSSVATPPAEWVRKLDELPNPARHIYQDDLYVPLPNQSRRRPATTVITSRGCPWARCTFCYQGGEYASGYRRRSPEHVVDEIARLVRDRGFRQIIFWDDNFCIRPEWVGRFCDLLDAEKLRVPWTVMARVNTVSLEMLRRMAASGCYNVYYGFESGNQEILDLINKGITLDDSRKAVKWAKEAGMEIRGSFILGLPTETPEMAERTIRFACELNVDWMLFFPYCLQPGTAIEELALREGRLTEHSMNMHLPSYVPNTYSSPAELSAMIKSAYRRYYLRPRYIMRALWQMRRPAAVRDYAEAFLFWLGLTRR